MELKPETVIWVLRYIAEHPKQTASQIMKGLEGKVTQLEFSASDDILTELGVIKSPWGKTRQGYANLYELCDSYTVKNTTPLIREMFSKK